MQGTFTIQWQRAHIAVADTKHENHDMALIFTNELADAVAKQAASEAALRGAAAERVACWRGRFRGGALRLTCKRPKPPQLS